MMIFFVVRARCGQKLSHRNIYQQVIAFSLGSRAMAIHPKSPASDGLAHPSILQAENSATVSQPLRMQLLPHITGDDATAANAAPNGISSRFLTVSNERQRRDSSQHRTALLKGNPGTRRRQRWENGILAHSNLTPYQLSLSPIAL